MSNEIITTRDTQLEKQRISKNALSLTEFDSTLEPAIAAGSVVEIGGSVFIVTVDEAITGWAAIGNDTDCYIKLVPTVADFTAEFTVVAPTWSTSKQGWYDGIDRFVAALHRGATAADFEDKWIFPELQMGGPTDIKVTAAGLVLGGTLTVVGDVGANTVTPILGVTPAASLGTSGAKSGDVIFGELSPYVPTIGNFRRASGGLHGVAGTYAGLDLIIASIFRNSGTRVMVHGLVVGSGAQQWLIDDGDAANTFYRAVSV